MINLKSVLMIIFVIDKPTCDLRGLYNVRSCQGNEFSCRGTQILGERRATLLLAQNLRVLLTRIFFCRRAEAYCNPHILER